MTTKLEHTGGEWHVHPQAPNEIWATRGPIAMTVARTDNDSSPAYDFEEEGNAHLLALAKTAPHECSNPKCPGDLNRRMLEVFGAVLDALKTCEQSITYLAEAEQPTSTDWVNLRAARHLARVAIANAPEETR